MSSEITVKLKFKLGTVKELGFGGLKQNWIDSDAQGHPGRKFSLTCGAGVGNSLLEASVEDADGTYLIAQADIRPLATAIFTALAVESDKQARARQAPGEAPGGS